jgi:hypothetical protein
MYRFAYPWIFIETKGKFPRLKVFRKLRYYQLQMQRCFLVLFRNSDISLDIGEMPLTVRLVERAETNDPKKIGLVCKYMLPTVSRDIRVILY